MPARYQPLDRARTPHLVALALVLLAGCGPTTAGTTDAGAGFDAPGSSGDAVLPDPDQTRDAAVCAAESIKAEARPLDIYLMLDQSASMADPVPGGNKWGAVTAALQSFIEQPDLTDVSIGLGYFPLLLPGALCTVVRCQTVADCGSGCGPCMPMVNICFGAATAGDSCAPADYAVPAVEIAPLPAVNAAIMASIATHGPTTNTPTSAALQGAIGHATAWAEANPTHATIVVLATDGEPSECDTSIPNIAAIAAAGASATPPILTFVVGVGAALANLNAIAVGGGTSQAFMVDAGGDVAQQFLDALNQIRGAALGCTYQIPTPEGGLPDFDQVNVQYTPGDGGPPQVIPQVPTQAACPSDGDAWYYDNPAAPTQIILCDVACAKVKADLLGAVDILLGCETIID
jgi:hypothetical protein